MTHLRVLTCAAVLAACLAPRMAAAADRTLIGDEAADSVVLRDVVARDDGTVTGVLVDRSTRLVRDVRLLIRHNWLWKDERHPGEDSPGRVAYHIVPADIPPGGNVEFRYRPDPPLPARSDGRFETTVEAVGVTEVGW